MSSSAGSTPPSGSGAKPVARGALVTHGRPEQIGDGIARLVEVARRGGRRADRSPRTRPPGTAWRRAATRPTRSSSSSSAATGRCSARCARTSGRAIPVIGVNFGRVGFLALDAAGRARGGPRPRVRRRARGGRAADARGRLERRDAGTSPSTTSSSRRRCSAAWSSSSGRSAARTSAACRATG